MLISDEYRKMNEGLHENKKMYGTSGAKWAPHVVDMSERLATKDVLDYGCGKSTLAQNLPFDIKEYDPCVPEKAARPEPADIIVCTDVLEHIEPECLDEVLDDLYVLMKKVGLFTIHNGPAKKHLADGRNAHLIQENEKWWLEKILKRFEMWSFRRNQGENHSEDNCVLEYVVYVTPRESYAKELLK